MRYFLKGAFSTDSFAEALRASANGAVEPSAPHRIVRARSAREQCGLRPARPCRVRSLRFGSSRRAAQPRHYN
jgi:hypothetical protein